MYLTEHTDVLRLVYNCFNVKRSEQTTKLHQEAHLLGDAYYLAVTRSAMNMLPNDNGCRMSGLAYLTALDKLRGHLQQLVVLHPEDSEEISMLIAQTWEYIDLVFNDLKATNRNTSPDSGLYVNQQDAEGIAQRIG